MGVSSSSCLDSTNFDLLKNKLLVSKPKAEEAAACDVAVIRNCHCTENLVSYKHFRERNVRMAWGSMQDGIWVPHFYATFEVHILD